MSTLLLAATALLAYFLGGLNGSIIASRFIFRRDIRNYGSGNAGLTNFSRTFGNVGLLAVALIDIVKSAAAVCIGWGLMSIVDEPTIGKVFAGFCLMMGHIYPALYRLKGGKGTLCLLVIATIVNWRIGVICLIIFVATLAITRYVSLSSIISALVFPICVWAFKHGGLEGVVALLCTLLLIFKHRQNLGRLIAGKERKLRFENKSKPKYGEEP